MVVTLMPSDTVAEVLIPPALMISNPPPEIRVSRLRPVPLTCRTPPELLPCPSTPPSTRALVTVLSLAARMRPPLITGSKAMPETSAAPPACIWVALAVPPAATMILAPALTTVASM